MNKNGVKYRHYDLKHPANTNPTYRLVAHKVQERSKTKEFDSIRQDVKV
jgi:DNA-directed RNA polymerase subunit L